MTFVMVIELGCFLLDAQVVFCPASFDGVFCWPPVFGGDVFKLKCPGTFQGEGYNPDEYARRTCNLDGTWINKSDYSACVKSKVEDYGLFFIYVIGYGVSFVSLCTALIIFCTFKSLMCLRNAIHLHLIVSFIIKVILFVCVTILSLFPQQVTLQNVVTTFYKFSQTANFFWMLIEGLYLFKVIYWTYGIDRVRLWHYGLIGWGFPIMLSLTWAVSKSLTSPQSLWYSSEKNHPEDLILNLPIVVILVVNFIVMIFIIYTLVVKLRAPNQPSQNRQTSSGQPSGTSREYRKAVKATLVLMPLLGATHIIFMTPTAGQAAVILNYIHGVLSSTQGFCVSLIYCFLNGEVRTAIRQRWQVYKDNQPIGRVPRDPLLSSSVANNRCHGPIKGCQHLGGNTMAYSLSVL